MDGHEFVRRLRAEPAIARTEVIFYSANYREQQARGLARAHQTLWPEEIIEVIEQALAHQTPSDTRPIGDDFARTHLRLMTDKLSEKANFLQQANQRLSALAELNLRLASERPMPNPIAR